MKGLFRHITKSLAGKLIIVIGILIIIGGGISWYVLINTSKKNLMSNAITHTASYSDLLKVSTRYSMLTFHREAIQKTIEDIGTKEDIKRIRIFDSKGKVFIPLIKMNLGSRLIGACLPVLAAILTLKNHP